MNNLYARMPGEDPEKPVVMLDTHTDECGFMVQSIREWKPGDPHARWSDPHEPSGTHSDPDQNWKLVRGIISSKPIHFMTEASRPPSR